MIRWRTPWRSSSSRKSSRSWIASSQSCPSFRPASTASTSPRIATSAESRSAGLCDCQKSNPRPRRRRGLKPVGHDARVGGGCAPPSLQVLVGSIGPSTGSAEDRPGGCARLARSARAGPWAWSRSQSGSGDRSRGSSPHVEPHHLRARHEQAQAAPEAPAGAPHAEVARLGPGDAGVGEQRELRPEPRSRGLFPQVPAPQRDHGQRVLRRARRLGSCRRAPTPGRRRRTRG